MLVFQYTACSYFMSIKFNNINAWRARATVVCLFATALCCLHSHHAIYRHALPMHYCVIRSCMSGTEEL